MYKKYEKTNIKSKKRKCTPTKLPIDLEILPIITLCVDKPKLQLKNNA